MGQAFTLDASAMRPGRRDGVRDEVRLEVRGRAGVPAQVGRRTPSPRPREQDWSQARGSGGRHRVPLDDDSDEDRVSVTTVSVTVKAYPARTPPPSACAVALNGAVNTRRRCASHRLRRRGGVIGGIRVPRLDVERGALEDTVGADPAGGSVDLTTRVCSVPRVSNKRTWCWLPTR